MQSIAVIGQDFSRQASKRLAANILEAAKKYRFLSNLPSNL